MMYDAAEVQAHFDRYAQDYWVGDFCSFGLLNRWRAACIDYISVPSPTVVCDAMSGTGKNIPLLKQKFGSDVSILSLDYSSQMQGLAARLIKKRNYSHVRLIQADALTSALPDQSMDALVCTFGLKTLSEAQQTLFATEIRRVLAPGGQFSLVEISLPKPWLMRRSIQLYLQHGPSCINWFCQRSYSAHRLLPVYTKWFGDCRKTSTIFKQAGLENQFYSLDGGMATGIFGQKK